MLELHESVTAELAAALDETRRAVAAKAGEQRVKDAEEATARRVANIENAVLKGLRAVSEKAASALNRKLGVEVRS